MPTEQQIEAARQRGRDADVLMAEFLGVQDQQHVAPSRLAFADDPMEVDPPAANNPTSRSQLFHEAAANRAREYHQRVEDQIAEGAALGLNQQQVMDMLQEGGKEVPDLPPPVAPVCPNAKIANVMNVFMMPSGEGMRRSSRSDSTFDQQQRENCKLILHFHENYPEQFCNDLDDFKHSIDYHVLFQRRYKGKLTHAQRIENHCKKLMTEIVGKALGPAGTKPTTNTVDPGAKGSYGGGHETCQ
jgi:hypothetical protein